MRHLVTVTFAVGCFYLTSCGCEIIDTGHRGVRTTFGEVEDKSLPEGLYTYNPFTSSIIELNALEQKLQLKISSYTKDIQQAHLEYVINYYPHRDKMHLLYKEFGFDWDEKIIPQIIEASVKDVLGKYDAVILIEQRQKAISEMETLAKEELEKRRVTLTKLEIINIDYNDAFEQAVEAKVIASQKAIEAKNKTVQIKEEADQKIISAKAEAESMRIRSQALRENKGLVDYEAVQKWNGVMPVYMMGNSVPFINLGKN